jgi:hypothetical protein
MCQSYFVVVVNQLDENVAINKKYYYYYLTGTKLNQMK